MINYIELASWFHLIKRLESRIVMARSPYFGTKYSATIAIKRILKALAKWTGVQLMIER